MEKENPHQPETAPEKLEIKEYSAKAGIAKAVSEIERLLAAQKYVVVAISGSSHDVGKTYVSSAIEAELIRRDISFVGVGSIETLLTKPVFEERRGQGHVLLFEAESPIFGPAEEGKRLQNQWLKEKIKEEKLKISVSKIDLRIYVYRPDKPFSEDVDLRSADVVIKNEEAVDDRGKMRKTSG